MFFYAMWVRPAQRKSGLEPDRLKLKGDWKSAVKKSLSKKNLLLDGLRGRNMGGMNRRQFTMLLPALGIAVGCDTNQKPSSTATLLNNSGVQDALQSLDSAIGDLESNVGRFDGEDWRDVVPDVESASSGVRSAFDDLRRALGVSNT